MARIENSQSEFNLCYLFIQLINIIEHLSISFVHSWRKKISNRFAF